MYFVAAAAVYVIAPGFPIVRPLTVPVMFAVPELDAAVAKPTQSPPPESAGCETVPSDVESVGLDVRTPRVYALSLGSRRRTRILLRVAPSATTEVTSG